MTQLDMGIMGSNQQLDDSAITPKNNFAAGRAAYFLPWLLCGLLQTPEDQKVLASGEL